MEDAEPDDAPFDPTSRKLCPDGACVGVIKADGVCSVCGRTEAQAAAGEEADASDEAPGEGPEAQAAGAGGFDTKRRLCDDGACVGVVGDDGVCRVCGRRAE
jgi:hypothetical protein